MLNRDVAAADVSHRDGRPCHSPTTPRGATRQRLAWAFLYVAILAIGVALGIQVVVDGYSPVPSSDLWAQFPFIERGVRGDFDLGDLWAQWNEHRIFLARIQFLLDYSIFGGTNVFLFVGIGTSCLSSPRPSPSPCGPIPGTGSSPSARWP